MIHSVKLVLQLSLVRSLPVVTGHPLLVAQRAELERQVRMMWSCGTVQKWLVAHGSETLLVYLIPTGEETGLLLGLDLSGIGETSMRYQETVLHTYHDVLYAATEGRLLVIHPGEIAEYMHLPEWEEGTLIESPRDIAACRHLATAALRNAGVPSQRVIEFSLSVSEAVTNVVKHAGTGKFRLIRTGDDWTASVSDSGPGIDLALLPHSTLLRGYSTKPSLGLGFTAMLRCLDRLVLATSPAGTTLLLQLFGPGGALA